MKDLETGVPDEAMNCAAASSESWDGSTTVSSTPPLSSDPYSAASPVSSSSADAAADAIGAGSFWQGSQCVDLWKCPARRGERIGGLWTANCERESDGRAGDMK